MPTVHEIYTYLQTVAPEYMAMQWDHIGLLCGRGDREVRRLLVALDPFMDVCREAKELNCELLVTHHPAIWDLKEVSDATQAGRCLLYLIENGISAVNAHTNLDCASDGVNDCLARTLGLTAVEVLHPDGTDAAGRPYGLLRIGAIEPTEPTAFVRHVKQALGCAGVRYVAGARPVRRVAVGGGACAGKLVEGIRAGCDAFVTADCKYNDFADAHDLGLTLVDAGHFQTENPVCDVLVERLRVAFPQIEVFRSKANKDHIKFA